MFWAIFLRERESIKPGTVARTLCVCGVETRLDAPIIANVLGIFPTFKTGIETSLDAAA